MADKFTIKIDSILGGIQPLKYFGASDEYLGSYAIDPDLPADSLYNQTGSGLPVPSFPRKFSGSLVTDTPLWIIPQPKSLNRYVYGCTGSVYSYIGTYATVSEVEKIAASSGNGATYYDNYVYFARDTSVCRYGPLDGAAAMTTNYWDTVLSKTALEHTPLAGDSRTGVFLPDHVMKRHRDGALYFADTIGNQGVLHKICTTKTTVEGDTDNGSAYNVIDFPWGYHVSAIESYGDLIVVALKEAKVNGASSNFSRAKLAFWDPTNPYTYDRLIDFEFPDAMITALYNSNGVLYTFSTATNMGSSPLPGVRVCRYIGGDSFEQVAFLDQAGPVFPGAVDGKMNRISFGGCQSFPTRRACIWTIGSKNAPISNSLHCTGGCSTNYASASITALKYVDAHASNLSAITPDTGWGCEIGADTWGLDTGSYNNGATDTYTNPSNVQKSIWCSQIYKIGQPFKITKIRLPLVRVIDANTSVSASLIADHNFTGTYTSTSRDWNSPSICSANYSNRNTVLRPNGFTGDQNFHLRLEFEGAVADTPLLPITIEGEYLDD